MCRLLLLLPLIILFSCHGKASSGEGGGTENTLQQDDFVASAADSLFYDEVMAEVLLPFEADVPIGQRPTALRERLMSLRPWSLRERSN
jgi:hypothetical protein